MKAVIPGDVTTEVHVQNGDFTLYREQDCEPILEDAKARHAEGVHGTGEMKHAARLPLVIVEKYCNDNNITFDQFMQGREHIRRVLNDPSLSYFRIWPGRI